jgi:hypothetical protein
MKRLISILLLLCLFQLTPGCDLFEDLFPSEPTPSEDDSTIVTLPPINQEIPESGETLKVDYEWSYDGKVWTWQLEIPQSLYQFYSELPRVQTNDYSIYVSHPSDNAYLSYLLDIFRDIANQEIYTDTQRVEFVVAFVQNLPYTSDSVTTSYDEYPRYPVETLVDNGGDCEDTSILMASLLDGLGYDVVLLRLPDYNHMAIGIGSINNIPGAYWEFNGNRYSYLETTGRGYEIGEIYHQYDGALVEIYPIEPVPIITHSWTATQRLNVIRMEISIENVGTAAAEDIYILVGFDNGAGYLWNAKESQHFNILPGQTSIITLDLSIPRSVYTRLIIQVVDDGYAVDESYSQWIDT